MDIKLFKQKVEENGLKYKYIAGKLGISENGLIKKRNGIIPWKIVEVNTLTALLHLSASERDAIFGLESPKYNGLKEKKNNAKILSY